MTFWFSLSFPWISTRLSDVDFLSAWPLLSSSLLFCVNYASLDSIVILSLNSNRKMSWILSSRMCGWLASESQTPNRPKVMIIVETPAIYSFLNYPNDESAIRPPVPSTNSFADDDFVSDYFFSHSSSTAASQSWKRDFSSSPTRKVQITSKKLHLTENN